MKLVKHLYPIPPPFGGVSIYVKRLTEKLNDLGYPSGAYYQKITDSSLDLNNYSLYKGLSRKRFVRNFIYLIKETREYSIVHSHDVFDDAIFLWLLSILKKKKIVITVHNAKAVTNYYKQPKIFRFFLKLLSKRSPTWIAVSPQGKEELLKLPIKFSDITVLPAFIPSNNKNSSSFSLSTKLKSFINSHDKIIFFYAYKILINNIDVYGCFDALNMFKELIKRRDLNIGLVFCLSDEEVDLINLKLFSKENNLSNNIFWQIGAINDMSQIWKITDVYIRPTQSDGDSIAVREAIGMNINVVASNVTSRPEETIVYEYGNNSNFVSNVEIALNRKLDSKNVISNNYQFFNRMLEIYLNLSKNE